MVLGISQLKNPPYILLPDLNFVISQPSPGKLPMFRAVNPIIVRGNFLYDSVTWQMAMKMAEQI